MGPLAVLSDAVPTQRALEELRQRWMDRTFRAFRPAPPGLCVCSPWGWASGREQTRQSPSQSQTTQPEPGPSLSTAGPRGTLHLGKVGACSSSLMEL